MQILDGLDSLAHAVYPKPVLALGNFDGVHLGHRAIFQQVVQRAQELGGTSMVFTFDPHPSQILAPDKAPRLLTTFAQKMRLIATTGMAVGLRVPFDLTFAQQPPLDFIREVLCQRIGVHTIVVGYDFRFGYRREGTAALLQEQALVGGYEAMVMAPVTHEGMVVSSSNIRQLIQAGRVETAARLLGRAYTIEGPVVEGFRRGTSLGFPTANVRSINDIVPHTGVYAVRVVWQEQRYPGVANVGYNPTFGNQKLSVEAHLFDLTADLYGATVRVEFVARIRDERKFASVQELVAQIAADTHAARAIHAQQPVDALPNE
jgi:riboflavin kinase/FMN adenylyltransferase